MDKAVQRDDILNLLRSVESREVSPEEALKKLRAEPFTDLGYAKVDHHRSLRQGSCEVIFGSGKTPGQVAGILGDMKRNNARNVLVTRISQQTADHVAESGIGIEYHPIPRLGIAIPDGTRGAAGNVVVASGGTSDMSVCEEAALTAEVLGSRVTKLYDVGVAGLHRLLARYEELLLARVVVAVAGMEGALASVIGGLVDCPVIAVPTSVGYGANFRGLAALLSMLNSCASGVSVVNIDNGFGAGFLANRINMMK